MQFQIFICNSEGDQDNKKSNHIYIALLEFFIHNVHCDSPTSNALPHLSSQSHSGAPHFLQIIPLQIFCVLQKIR